MPCSLSVQECKFILEYLYQCGRKDGQMTFDTFLAAVRAFGLKHEVHPAEEEAAKWQVRSVLGLCAPFVCSGTHILFVCDAA